jgi:hypothetical protein
MSFDFSNPAISSNRQEETANTDRKLQELQTDPAKVPIPSYEGSSSSSQKVDYLKITYKEGEERPLFPELFKRLRDRGIDPAREYWSRRKR